MDQDSAKTLGRIEGLVEGVVRCQAEHSQALKGIDDRLRHVESKAATYGAVSGSLAALGIGVVAALVKARLGVA